MERQRVGVPKRAYINQPSALGGALARFDLGTSNTLDASDSGWFYHYDESLNVILITDKNGAIMDQFEQDAWGNDLNNTFNTARAIKQHQTNKYYDDVAKLYFFGARWYDPAIGRFISVSYISPLYEEEYSFCSNDPINLLDIDGTSIFSNEGDTIFSIVDNHWSEIERYDPNSTIRGFTSRDIRELNYGITLAGEYLRAGAETSWIYAKERATGYVVCAPVGLLGGAIKALNIPLWNPNPGKVGHIFQKVSGHVAPRSNASRNRFIKLFQNVASNPANLRDDYRLPSGAKNAGIKVYTQNFNHGQIWVYVRNGVIQDAGKNLLGKFR